MPSRPEPSVPATVERRGEVCHVGGTLDFDTARGALEAVVPLIERGEVSSVDLGGVTRSNSAGLALMIEWLATARRAGRPLHFSGVPDGLRQLAGVCQVSALLGDTTEDAVDGSIGSGADHPTGGVEDPIGALGREPARERPQT